MTPDEQARVLPTLSLINTELTGRLARQSTAGATIDTKTVFLLGFLATAAQFLAAQKAVQPLLAAAAFLAYAVACVLAVSVLRLEEYQDLEPRAVLDTYGRAPEGELLLALAATRATMFEHNARLHRRRAKRWTVSLVSAGVGIALSSAAIVLQTGSHGERVSPVPGSSPSAGVSPSQSH
ncbi:hypothetical protein AB0O42_16855 [Streptomyces sp. NPDC089922]|uniref:hypothetical protein n=1 Tax=Streptomyces sp. NPDC089922 TaxID=3155189 RepID=UPI00342CCFA5